MPDEVKNSGVMNIVLWIAQLLLTAAFVWSGYMKLFHPEALPFPWVHENPGLAKLTAAADLLAGLGLVLPGLLSMKPRLTVWAAYGTIDLMVAAIVFHVSRGEASQTGFNFFVIVIAAFVVWGRRKKAPLKA